MNGDDFYKEIASPSNIENGGMNTGWGWDIQWAPDGLLEKWLSQKTAQLGRFSDLCCIRLLVHPAHPEPK